MERDPRIDPQPGDRVRATSSLNGSRGYTFSPERIAEIRALEEQCKGWPDGAHDAFMADNGVSLYELFDYWEVTGQVKEAPDA